MKISPYKISAGKTAPLIALATLSLLSGCATLSPSSFGRMGCIDANGDEP